MASWTFNYGQLQLSDLTDEQAHQIQHAVEAILNGGRRGGTFELTEDDGTHRMLFLSAGVPMYLTRGVDYDVLDSIR